MNLPDRFAGGASYLCPAPHKWLIVSRRTERNCSRLSIDSGCRGRRPRGSGLLLALAVLRPELEFDIEPLIYGFNPSQREAQRSGPSLFDMKPVAPGSYQSGAIVLISDGRRTTGRIRSLLRNWPHNSVCASTRLRLAHRTASSPGSKAVLLCSG